jgi:erythromycin esterase
LQTFAPVPHLTKVNSTVEGGRLKSPDTESFPRLKSTLAVMALVTTSIGLVAAQEGRPSSKVDNWIVEHAVPVRSIDTADADFSDLEPLVNAIGAATVIQLGEPSHGAGAAFAAKVRLVKFLHERMGFDVLAWESGFYDVSLTQAGMRTGEDGVTAAEAGILLVWSATEEVKPLFDYVRTSQATTRPLQLAGFDSQLNGISASDSLAADLRSFVGTLRDQALCKHASELVERIIAAHQHLYARTQQQRRAELDSVTAAVTGKTPAQSPSEVMSAWEKSDAAKLTGRKEDMESLDRATDELLSMINAQHAAFLQTHSTRDITFMERVVENLRGNDNNIFDNERPDRPTAGPAASALVNQDWNRRDALNAQNLKWLVESGYPGQKIIVWAHNAHVMNAYYAADLNSIHSEPQAEGLEPSGVSLRRWLGRNLYTIVMTSYAGEDGWNSANPIAPAPEDSLEWQLHQLGKPYVFLDLHSHSDAHPIHEPQSIRLDKYREDTLTDVSRAFDAVFYIDRMTPATRIRSLE